ncbi:hypothetical protein ACFC00_25920 [Streptomyces adustus]|uniref:hypothetical protein n=1 Tax=Streptomyces adustus TaxID=1609272 RepID=UPI0035DDBA9A
MRGLTGTGPTAARGTFQAVFTAMLVITALGLFAAGCATGGTGARDEGPAHSDTVAGAVPSLTVSPSGTPAQVDAVRLVKADPKVSAEVKRGLKPCVGDDYPVDVSYGDLTGGPSSDIVVNVLTCADAVGLGSYVYREQDGRYTDVFKVEEPPAYAEIDRGDLVVTKQVYGKDDPVSSPSGEDVITYRWSVDHFTEKYRSYNDYSNAAGTTPTPAPDRR